MLSGKSFAIRKVAIQIVTIYKGIMMNDGKIKKIFSQRPNPEKFLV